jgi:hypothetical protein
MPALYLIYDEGGKDIRIPPIKGVSSASIQLAPEYEFTLAEIEHVAQHLTKQLLEVLKPIPTDEAPAPDQT